MELLNDYAPKVAGSVYDQDIDQVKQYDLGNVFKIDNLGEGRDGIPVDDKAKHKSYIQAAFSRAGIGARFQEFVEAKDAAGEPTGLGYWIVKSANKRVDTPADEKDQADAPAE